MLKSHVLDPQVIRDRLTRLEAREGIRILYACESGSRCWGFASPDSDYDIRFIYVRQIEDYLSIDPVRDVIEEPVDELWDLNGWDLGKALRLMKKSNSSLIEWLQSPIVYYEVPGFRKSMLDLAKNHYSNEKLFNNYRGMARGNYREYLTGKEVLLKKYLYVLRPLLACEWIEEKGSYPPAVFQELLDFAKEAHPTMVQETEALLVKKKAGLEKTYGPRLVAIDDYIENQLAKPYCELQSLDKDDSELNTFFRNWIIP